MNDAAARPTHEREITEPVSLTRPDGTLNPDAVGWTRRQLHDTSGIGRGRTGRLRNKRWEYWAITTPDVIAAVTVAMLDYATLSQVWVLDRRSLAEVDLSAVTPLSRGVTLPGSLGDGPADRVGAGHRDRDRRGTRRHAHPRDDGPGADRRARRAAGGPRGDGRRRPVERPAIPVHGEGCRAPGSRHDHDRRDRARAACRCELGDARPWQGALAVPHELALGRRVRSRARPHRRRAARRPVDRRHGQHRERAVARRPGAQARRRTRMALRRRPLASTLVDHRRPRRPALRAVPRPLLEDRARRHPLRDAPVLRHVPGRGDRRLGRR